MAQTNSQLGPFNESYWNGYADKLHLTPKEREEFISAHRLAHNTPTVNLQPAPSSQLSGGRGIDPNNNTFAGPCINADFEAGNIGGWTNTWGYNPGFSLTPACCPTPGGAQTIMSGAANDPFGPFPVVCPGGNYSLRLGNSATGGIADRIEQTFLVSPSNANFSYKYAVVFQDPGHTPAQQPYFEIALLDTLGNAIPCTFYHVASGAGIPGFFNSTTAGVIYKPWSTVLVDLTPYMGQNITIRFSTFDCSLGGHFGYAYIDGVCQSFASGGSASVCAGTSTTFCAPSGVASYTWNGPGLSNYANQCATVSSAGVYTVSTTLFTGCTGPNFTYTLINQAPPVADAGPVPTVCANNNTVSINGSITGFSATPIWSSGGSGVFTSTANLATTYTPSAADVAAGSVTITLTTDNNGLCPASTSKMVVSITPSPVVSAGSGGPTCDSAPFALNGSVTGGASTGSWSTAGDGSFSLSNAALNASYTPGPGDISAGSATLTLTSTNFGNCLATSNTVVVQVKHPAIVNAGINQTLCSTTPSIAISGTVGGGSSTGIWSSSGAGGYSPSTSSLNSTYSITAADIAAGSVIFTLTSTNNGPCPAVTDTVKMAIIKPSTVTAGANQFLCSTSGSINLTGLVTGFSSTGNWVSNGSGTFSPGGTSLSNSYLLAPADISAGSVIFTLTSTNNGPCAAVNDSVQMRIRIPATANAGANQVLCSNAASVSLSGTIGGGSSTGIWSGSGTGAFTPSVTSLNSAYAINAGDVASGVMTFTLTSTNNGPCAAVQDTVLVPIVKMATVSAGPNLFVCSSTTTLNLAGSVVSPSNTGSWSSSGTGSFVPGAGAVSTTYSFSPADVAAGTVIFTLTSTNNSVCPAVNDTVKMRIMKLASVNAGTTQTLCSNIPTLALNGNLTGAAGTGSWSTSGTGAFAGITSFSTTYSITPADISAGTVVFTLTSTNNGPCAAVTNTAGLNISPIATLNAGPNQFVCSSQNSIALSGSVTGVTSTGHWTASGTGPFAPSSSTLATTYTMTPQDIQSGFVTFTLASTNNGVCPVVTDTVKMRVMKQATVNAGSNQALCSTIHTLSLGGTVAGVNGTGAWTSTGLGSFIPASNSLSTIYSITPADVTAGMVIFTLTSTNNGPCPAINDSVEVTIRTLASVNAGANQYICSAQGSLALSGTVTGGTSSGQWTSSSAGNFVFGSTSLLNTYSLSPVDILNGAVIFTLTSTNNGACPAVKDTVKMRIMKMPVANAGPNQSLCSSQGTIALAGNVNGGGNAGTWVSNGSGSFIPSAGSAITAYSMSPQDVTNGLVIFTLSSQSSSPCPEVSDTVAMVLRSPSQVTAGSSQTICSQTGSISLPGAISGGLGTGIWSTSGTGTFNPGNTSLASTYLISQADITNGVINFTLTSTNNGGCSANKAITSLIIRQLAQVDAGPDKPICSTQLTIPLSGAITGVTSSGIWSGNGAGTFSPNLPIGGSYNLTPADIAQGHLTFVLTSLNNDICPAVSDTMNVTIVTSPKIVLQADTSFCEKHTRIALSPTVTGSGGVLQWTSSGSGTFLPSSYVPTATYNISQADITAGNVILQLGLPTSGPCGNISSSFKLHILPGPHASFSASAYTISLPGSAVQLSNLSVNANSYTWNFGDGETSSVVSPEHGYGAVGVYKPQLIAKNSNGCSDTTVQQIVVISDVQFPNAFTPDPQRGGGGTYNPNDYSNDVFFPYTQGVVEYDLMIFNRWGELIFRSRDINIGWDGYFNGKLCQQDVYVWKADMVFFDGRKLSKTGSITLLR